jgi:hypothetical protein
MGLALAASPLSTPTKAIMTIQLPLATNLAAFYQIRPQARMLLWPDWAAFWMQCLLHQVIHLNIPSGKGNSEGAIQGQGCEMKEQEHDRG